MIVIDQTGTIVLYNAACERLFGYAAGDVLGRNVNLLMPSPDRENHDAYLQNYLKSGIAGIIGIGRDVTGCRKDGSTFPMHLSVGELSRTRDGPLFVGTIHDLSERRRARERIDELNLVRNSIEALDGCETRRIVIATTRLGDGIELTVSDTGPGLPASVQVRPFEPFVSTKPGGTGIGLSICRTIAEVHGGEISFHTEAGKGTTFHVVIPVFDETDD